MENTQLAKQPTEPMVVIQEAIKNGADISTLERLFALQERHEQNEAARAFAAAISAFQAEVPIVLKSRTAKIDDKWSYQFASYDDIMRQVSPLLAKHEIVVTFSTDQIPQVGIKTTCRVRVGTHFEDHTLTVPIPQMKVNATQQFGAALAYAKRYALCAALNIVVSDEDDDAARLLDNVDEEEVAAMRQLIVEKQVDEVRFLKWAEADALEQIPKAMFPKAMDMLRRKK